MSTIASTQDQVKAKFLEDVSKVYDRVMGRAESPDAAVFEDLEHLTATGMREVAANLLGRAFARTCEAAMEQDLAQRGLTREEVRVRGEKDYMACLSTTLGVVAFPWFAFRFAVGPTGMAFRTVNPARALLPYYRLCRSSPLLLQWEVRLGARDAFRKAQELLGFFTRGALDLEDTTMQRHMNAAARLIDPKWLYRTPDDIRKILLERATKDLGTGRPLIYVSTDGHALRRYVGETWAWGWMVINGVRLWCEDARTGAIIHLGGEFTWGDCHAVGERFKKLLALGILPNDEVAWTAVQAQVVFISDGAEWIADHVLPLLKGAFVILDPFHVVGWFAALGSKLFGAGSSDATAFHALAWSAIFGPRPPKRPGADLTRKGHKKRRAGERRDHAHDRHRRLVEGLQRRDPDAMTKALLALLAGVEVHDPEDSNALRIVLARVTNNALRMAYPTYLARGLQVGSGAMESLHRSASQPRLKRSGRWLQESSQAVLQFRMLELSGRWNEFWHQHDLALQLVGAFGPPAPQPANHADANPVPAAA